MQQRLEGVDDKKTKALSVDAEDAATTTTTTIGADTTGHTSTDGPSGVGVEPRFIPIDTVDEPIDAQEERAKSIDALIGLLPKSIRKKAQIVLESGGVQFDRNTYRVIYSGGQRGSHLLDLLTYVLMPKFITDKKSPPPDSQQFVALLQANPSVPDSVSLPKATVTTRPKFPWLSCF